MHFRMTSSSIMLLIIFTTMLFIQQVHCQIHEDQFLESSETALSSGDPLPVDERCTFDDGTWCGWEQDQDQDGDRDFLMRRGTTPSSRTGPDADHTYGTKDGTYIYLESSSPAREGQKARLKGTIAPCKKCITFWYHMYGASMGQLHLIGVDEDGLESRLLSFTGNKGKDWSEARVTVDSTVEILFEAVRGRGWLSDIALDDITVTDGACPVIPQPPAKVDGCSFGYRAQTLCSFRNADDNTKRKYKSYDWALKMGGTPTRHTGPSADRTSGSGYYIYLEGSSPYLPGDKGRLMTPLFNSTAGRCLHFSYHMYGADMGILRVYLRQYEKLPSYERIVIFRMSGNQGDSWHDVRIPIVSPLQYQIVFEGIRGKSFRSDIALDDVYFTEGQCK